MSEHDQGERDPGEHDHGDEHRDPPAEECWCRRCEEERNSDVDGFWRIANRHRIRCSECGFKHCPKADFHGERCVMADGGGR